MNVNSLLADLLKSNLGMLQNTLADFSDADMFVRPAPGANHAAWQIGHLAYFEAMVANLVAPGKVPASPAEWGEKFGRSGASIDDPAAFPPPRQLLELLAKARGVMIDYVKTAPAEDFDKPSPEGLRGFAPTMGHLLASAPAHTCMHIGQFQVLRRKLGKPILF